MVHGDVDVVEAHVDSCLAHVNLTNEQEERRRSRRGSADLDGDLDVDVDGEEGFVAGVMEGVSFRGTGFDIPNRNAQDVDDDIDIDGEDEAVFGAPQFTEDDILGTSGQPDADEAASNAGTDAEVDVDDTTGVGEGGPDREPKQGKTFKDLVAEGKMVLKRVGEAKRSMEAVMGVGDTEQADLAVELARRAGDPAALVRALENKVKLLEATKVSSSTSLLCRICLDPYTEPTVSTGCWHTCCRECWLRCLGSTKLCPICKRITGASDLRRVTHTFVSSEGILADEGEEMEDVEEAACLVRIFTPSDVVLGQYGTALWIDASTDINTPSQAGDRGQRIAGKLLTQTPLPKVRLRPGESPQDDQVSPGPVDPATLAYTGQPSGSVNPAEQGPAVSVFHVQESDEKWNRVAVDEETGRIALGHTDGTVSVYSYVPS
ncbi:hypothetical protein NUW54_g5050 [Trametes sanguinea]|uniref:Uncharacterized protein n=1 Tax=Trametes sanguinea TaxID=158606 RepID=A0ACC1PYX5_9APHY|nr:hypothetical protein NUW54_g5050 [Trametes sanguinea]